MFQVNYVTLKMESLWVTSCVLCQENRHINFFSGLQTGGFRVGLQIVHVEHFYVLFLSLISQNLSFSILCPILQFQMFAPVFFFLLFLVHLFLDLPFARYRGSFLSFTLGCSRFFLVSMPPSARAGRQLVTRAECYRPGATFTASLILLTGTKQRLPGLDFRKKNLPTMASHLQLPILHCNLQKPSSRGPLARRFDKPMP